MGKVVGFEWFKSSGSLDGSASGCGALGFRAGGSGVSGTDESSRVGIEWFTRFIG